MSNFKISQDLLLEKQELNRFKRFVVNDGHRAELLLHTYKFGIVNGVFLSNGNFIENKDCFKVENIGSSSSAVNILPGRAVDKYGRIITLLESKTLQIPNDSLWYWIKINYNITNTEIGTISLSSDGTLNGFGTKFTEVLRGQPNFPIKIKFENSINNTYEYEVVEVIDDENAIISGSFTAENDLKYIVVGTFTPGYVPPVADKYIYEYDDVNISVIQENLLTPGQQPANIDNEEFYLARVRTNGLNVIIEDKRVDFWKTKEAFHVEKIVNNTNPIIGVESVKWNIYTTPRDKNEINISWGYRTTNWSVDTTQNKITINSGYGGILKENNLSNYIDGSFDNWRLYCKNGKYYNIVSSQKSGSQLNIVLDYLDPINFNINDELWIVPDVEEIEIIAASDFSIEENKVIYERFCFPIYFGECKIYLRIMHPKDPYKYNLKFRYKNHFEYSQLLAFPDDPVGFYSEKSFKANGFLNDLLIDREQKPYIYHPQNGYIEIVPAPNNYISYMEYLFIGDLYGVEYRTLSNSSDTYYTIVGKHRQYQVINSNPPLNDDMFIILDKTRNDGTPCVNGNRFIFWLKNEISIIPSRNIRFVTDYVDPINYTLIHELNPYELFFVNNSEYGLRKEFCYDGTDWICDNVHEITPGGTVVMYSGDLSVFDSTGLGISKQWKGWALCNGQNGTPDLRGRFIVGYHGDSGDGQGDYKNIGELGPVLPPGSYETLVNNGKQIILGSENIPPHKHKYTFFTSEYLGEVAWSIKHLLETGNSYNQIQTGPGELAEGNDSINRTYVTETAFNTSGFAFPFENRPPFYVLAFVYKL